MTNNVEKRAIILGEYIIDTKATVRQTANAFGISKSTVHIDVTKRLRETSPTLAKDVMLVLQENKAMRHIRGGEATREKYLSIRSSKQE